MPAITTEYLGPTNTLSGRIVTKSHAKRIVVAWDSSRGVTENHVNAAKHHAAVMGWIGDWTGSSLGKNGGMVFVRPNLDSETFTVSDLTPRK